MRTSIVIVACLVATACTTTNPAPRPLENGFATSAGVADPYEDGKRQLAAGRYETAVERFGQALANDRRSLGALNGLAIAYARLGRFDIAQTYFERALRVDPTDASTLNNYGRALIEQGRLREAKPFLELALRYAADADVPVVAANAESIARARPPAVVAALDPDRRQEAHADRLVRVSTDVYRLETLARPAAEGDDRPGSAQASPGPAVARPHKGPIQLWPEPVSEPEAAAMPEGEKT